MWFFSCQVKNSPLDFSKKPAMPEQDFYNTNKTEDKKNVKYSALCLHCI